MAKSLGRDGAMSDEGAAGCPSWQRCGRRPWHAGRHGLPGGPPRARGRWLRARSRNSRPLRRQLRRVSRARGARRRGHRARPIPFTSPSPTTPRSGSADRRTAYRGRPCQPFAQSAGGMLTDAQIDVLVKGIRAWASRTPWKARSAPRITAQSSRRRASRRGGLTEPSAPPATAPRARERSRRLHRRRLLPRPGQRPGPAHHRHRRPPRARRAGLARMTCPAGRCPTQEVTDVGGLAGLAAAASPLVNPTRTPHCDEEPTMRNEMTPDQTTSRAADAA